MSDRDKPADTIVGTSASDKLSNYSIPFNRNSAKDAIVIASWMMSSRIIASNAA
jgi:hypothetical protein